MHLSLLAGIVLPFIGLALPILIWFNKKDSSLYVSEQGTEMMNFLVNIFIISLGVSILCFVIIGLVLLIPVLLFAFIMPIVAAIKCSKGQDYRYPIIYKFIK